MTGLKWVRLDTAFPRNHKILALTHDRRWRAIVLYINALAYAGEQGTDGWVPQDTVKSLHGRLADAQELVLNGLWIPRPGGWEIHDWLDYQPSSEETAARSQHAKSAALTRWAQTPRNGHRPTHQAMPDAMPDA